jgi:hypothetical protein
MFFVQRAFAHADWLGNAVFNAKLRSLQRTTKHIALFSSLTASYLRKITKKITIIWHCTWLSTWQAGACIADLHSF